MERTWNITTLDSLRFVVAEVLVELKKTESPALVLALHGDLGAGKTTFVQHLAKALGVAEIVTSPTFVIAKNYATTDRVFTNLLHIDAYRIESDEELVTLDLPKAWQTPGTLTCIEWPTNVKALLPEDAISLSFHLSKDHRSLTLKS